VTESDEIERLARSCLNAHPGRSLDVIDANIDRATARKAWDEVGKWNRVRLRLIRMRFVRSARSRGALDQPAAG
jgi:hypothetical protein